ncbi:hypothetical protein [Azospirillum sp. sgz302134]
MTTPITPRNSYLARSVAGALHEQEAVLGLLADRHPELAPHVETLRVVGWHLTRWASDPTRNTPAPTGA